MHMEQVTVSDMVSGKKCLPKGLLKIVDHDIRANYWVDRIVLQDESGSKWVLKGNSYIEVYEEFKPEPVTRFKVEFQFRDEIKGQKLYETKRDAETWIDTLNDDWKATVTEVQVLPGTQTDSPVTEIPF